MSQADELINGLSNEEFALYTANPTEEQHIIVDENRIITVPSELKKIAVQYDHNIETVTFDCIRYWDGHDMSTMNVYINYTRSDKYTGCYLADNVRVDEADNSIIHFDWTISRNVTESVGPLTILVCIKMVDADGNEVNHWNSERNTDMIISQGMECGDIIVNKYPDVITYLLNMRFPVNYLESLDSANMVNLRDLDSGTYILKGKFRPFDGSTYIYTFSSGMLLSIIKQETISYVQIFYSKDNTIQYLEIRDSSVTRKDTKLINMESIANKVTDINEGSDDYHYPSAKAVYNAITKNSITTSTATNLTGLLKGNGTNVEAAVPEVDYATPEQTKVFMVTFSSNDNGSIISDKSRAEIYSAYMAGKVVVGRHNNSVYQLCIMDPTSGSYMHFICCSGLGIAIIEGVGDSGWANYYYTLVERPDPVDALPEGGYELQRNKVYNVYNAVDTYEFIPPSEGWAHGIFSTGKAPNITFRGAIIGKLPDFAADKVYEFDVYDGIWAVQEVVAL